MRLKEIPRTAHQAWSPAAHHPTYLATGTSAQQLDASFSTSAALEIFEMDFSDPSPEMKLRGALSSTNRFHSLLWANFGLGADGSSGRLIGGSENGVLVVYSPDEILASGEAAIIGQSEKHTGPVRALDFNPFQSNLVASGANDSEIYIWDLNNFSDPMTPGAKSQLSEPLEDISVVAWNRQVQHILASASPSGKAVVWDLRKNEPIIKISDHSNRMRCSGMLWHPEVATQLVLASEDDRLPVIQMWDLRFATSPLKVLENHTRGILSISWSQADPELLLSSAKDNRILCWNPTTGEVIYELPTTNQWCFNVQWCPRNPALLSAASFDGHISVYSVMGGCLQPQQQSSVEKISSSFDTMDPFGTGQALPPLQVPQPTTQATVVPPLKKPPKWVRRPVGASFAFGGKLVTFENLRPQPQQQGPQTLPRQVFISQVVTETEFLQRSNELQAALQSGAFSVYCQGKVQNSLNETEQDIWRFLKVNFEDDARVKFLRLLGFSKEELERKISSNLGKDYCANGHGVDTNDLDSKMRPLSAQRSDDPSAANSMSSSDFFSNLPKDKPSFQIPVSADTEGLISQALLVGNFEGAVELCLNTGRFAEAILLSISGGEELLRKTQRKYLDKQKSNISMLISSVVTQNWRDIVQSCDLENWKEALAALLTYARPEEFAPLCDTLGARLEQQGREKCSLQACLCYICSGNMEKLVECWSAQRDCSSPLALEDLVEKVMILRKSIERLQNGEITVQSPALANKLTHYASLLAAQGSLAAAISYLPANSNQEGIQMLRDRLFHAQGEAAEGQPPPVPYARVPVGGAPDAPTPSAALPLEQKMQKQVPYQPTAPAPSTLPSAPVMFTPPAPPTDPWAPPSFPGMPPTSHMPRPPYPQHPAATSGYPFQPFSATGAPPIGGQAGFPPGPTIPASSLSGPPVPSSSGPALPSMPSVGPPHSNFMPPSSLPSGPLAPPPSSQPGAPVPMFPGGPHAPGPAPPPISSSHYNPAYPQGGPGAPAAKPFSGPAVAPPPTGPFPWLRTRSEDEGIPQEGWNDPPTVRGGPRKKKMPVNYTPPTPITAPVMGYSAEPAHPQEGVQAPPGAPQEPSVQLLQQLPTEKVEQRAIPPEHLVLKSTFDGLVQRCQLAAGDPQTKRKLDDASKRLEHLYDRLRDQTLSPSILAGLHEIGRCIECRNYQNALAVHTQIVSSSNFSEISAFMPILKVVMTIANKLSI